MVKQLENGKYQYYEQVSGIDDEGNAITINTPKRDAIYSVEDLDKNISNIEKLKLSRIKTKQMYQDRDMLDKVTMMNNMLVNDDNRIAYYNLIKSEINLINE